MLREFAGWESGDEEIRPRTHTTTVRRNTRREGRAYARRFVAARGVVEVRIDTGKVNTTTGWRDVKLWVIGKRMPGEAGPPSRGAVVCSNPRRSGVVANLKEAGVRAEADWLGATAGDVTVPARVRGAHRVLLVHSGKQMHRMDYPRYRAKGWLIGPGPPVGAACKQVVGQRTKGCGGARAARMPCAASTPRSAARKPRGMTAGLLSLPET